MNLHKRTKPISRQEIDAINKKCYDHHANYWDRMPFADFLPQWITDRHNPSTGYRTLDIGSGTGLLAKYLQNSGFEVVCIDPSDEMTRRCRALGLTTIQTPLQEFACEGKFGLITAILSLIHVPKYEMSAQIKRISNWLNPGGIFALAVIEGKGEGLNEQDPYSRYFSYYSRDEIKQMLDSDFVCLAERQVGSPISYLVFIFCRK